MRSNSNNAARGFTLIEVMAVLFITALLAALVGVSMTGAMRLAVMEDAIAAVEQFDRLTRQQARRFDRPMRLRFDLRTGTVMRLNDEEDQPQQTALALPAGYRLTGLVLADDEASDGQWTVPCSPAGYTPTYAVCITTDGTSTQSTMSETRRGSTWLVFAGLSGATMRLDDEQQVRKLFDALRATASGRADAD